MARLEEEGALVPKPGPRHGHLVTIERVYEPTRPEEGLLHHKHKR